MSHTKGPWQWEEPSNWCGLALLVRNEKHEPIAQIYLSGWPRKIAKANADIVAAAPEMLSALKSALVALMADEDIERKEKRYGMASRTCDEIRAAIVKAEKK